MVLPPASSRPSDAGGLARKIPARRAKFKRELLIAKFITIILKPSKPALKTVA